MLRWVIQEHVPSAEVAECALGFVYAPRLAVEAELAAIAVIPHDPLLVQQRVDRPVLAGDPTSESDELAHGLPVGARLAVCLRLVVVAEFDHRARRAPAPIDREEARSSVVVVGERLWKVAL